VTYLRDIVDDAHTAAEVHAPWNRKLRHSRFLASPAQAWVTEEDVDLDYHVRRSALPSPGGERELGVLVSRLHSNQLDLSRPPWEVHMIEGQEGGRFSIYTKVHHSLIDGFTGMRLTVRGLSRDPEERDRPLAFLQQPARRREPAESEDSGMLADLGTLVSDVRSQAGSAVNLVKRIADPFLRRNQYSDLVHTVQAPPSILNGRIGRNRRFATQQYSLPRIKAIGSTNDATINDVVLAVVAGGLRTFLSGIDELPDKPLVAFLPVNVRTKDDVGGGNAVGAILASLATDVADPIERLHLITASTSMAKAQLDGMTQEAILAYSAYLMAPTGIQALSAITGIHTPLPLAFNVCVSNVPGPKDPLYLRGSRLEAFYPASIPAHGMALNITLFSYADTINVGFVGCRDTLPHLQRLAVDTGQAFADLDKASA
jgi:WS/DGAT/MGAT family acyltransferase